MGFLGIPVGVGIDVTHSGFAISIGFGPKKASLIF